MTEPDRRAVQDLVHRYANAGSTANGRRRRRAGRTFLDRFGDPAGWQRAPLADQFAADQACSCFVAWLIVTAQVWPSADYLLACRGRLASIGDLAHPQLSAGFGFTSNQLGYPLVIARRQWSALLQVAALTGTAPTRLSAEHIGGALTEFRAAADRSGRNRSRNLSAEVFGMQSVLFHLGLLDRLPARSNGRDGRRAADWARIAERVPVIAATMSDYLDQLSVRLRPNSLRTIDTSLRLFAPLPARATPGNHRHRQRPAKPRPGLQDLARRPARSPRTGSGQPDPPWSARHPRRVLRPPRRSRHR